ncbi:trypsin-like cysteine/serine peptidase domain-containing protein, partial [Globomyces pollinis-pini]
CGGALLDQNTVLTAAHCSEGVKPTSVVVHAHFLSLQDIGKISVQFRVNEIIIHPKYNSQTFNNDVSIWKVSPEFGDTKQLKIYPTLADKTNTYVGNVLTAAGWGRTLNGSATGSDTLREVNLKVLDDTSCQQIYSVIPRNAFCAGSSKVEKVNSQNDTCQGDSGGPLFDQSTPPTIVGIVSNGVDCGSAAGIYADVASLLPWI